MADFPDSTPMTEISRPVVEAEIELLIGLLDQLDEDPDLEDNADLEPSTGDEEPLHGALEQRTGAWGGLDHSIPDCFEGEELELGWTEMEARFGRYHGAFSDAYEPSLGSTAAINQIHWSKGSTDDSEDEHDGREDCCEDEGAQCDDEGAIECDTMLSDDEIVGQHYLNPAQRAATTEAIVTVHEKLRLVMKQKGRKPVAPLRVSSGVIWK